MIVELLEEGHPVSEIKLKEVLGHTPLQVGPAAAAGLRLLGPSCRPGSRLGAAHTPSPGPLPGPQGGSCCQRQGLPGVCAACRRRYHQAAAEAWLWHRHHAAC
jgi:hypothetical protein